MKEIHLIKVSRKEKKILSKKEFPLFLSQRKFVGRTLARSMPQKAQRMAEAAFMGSFDYIFSMGTDIVEKTFDAKKIKRSFAQFYKKGNLKDKDIHRMSANAWWASFFHCSLSSLKSAVLGFFGVGLPDIPVFIGVMLSAIYQTALRFGFSYTAPAEKAFILTIICTALSAGEEKKAYALSCDALGQSMERGDAVDLDLQELVEQASHFLFLRAGSTKLLQGVLIAGVLGGVFENIILREVSEMAALQYKKRFLRKLKV